MKKAILLISLVLPIYLFAQGFGSFSHDQPFFAKDVSISGPGSPGDFGANYWWLYSTMPTNDVAVTNWVDQIVGSSWANEGAASTRPINTTNGVYFLGFNSQRLTNSSTSGAGIPLTDNSVTWLIISRASNGVYHYVLSKDGGGSLNAGFAGDNRTMLEQAGAVKYDGTIPINTFFDVAWASDMINNKTYIFTNGVIAATNTPKMASGNFWEFMGWNLSAGSRSTVYIKEMAVWTNSNILTNLTMNLSNLYILHQYGTNKYGY